MGLWGQAQQKKDALETFQSSLVITKSRTACRACKEICKRDNDLADRCLLRFSYSYAFLNLFYLSICHTQSPGNSVYTYVQTHTDAVTKASTIHRRSVAMMIANVIYAFYMWVYIHTYIFVCVYTSVLGFGRNSTRQ